MTIKNEEREEKAEKRGRELIENLKKREKLLENNIGKQDGRE